jgi:hypothetical protein
MGNYIIIWYTCKVVGYKEGEELVLNELYTYLAATTGDSGKPILVAICLIVSIVLMVVLIITGRSSGDDSEDNTENKGEDR